MPTSSQQGSDLFPKTEESPFLHSPVSLPPGAQAEPLLKQMTLDERVGQLNESSPKIALAFTPRYWDVASKPLYPFGYSLSYTAFKFSNVHLSRTR